MSWLERILVSAAAAGMGAVVTLLWIGDDPGSASPQRAGATDPRVAQLAEEVAAQAGMLAQLTADNVALTLRLRELERGRGREIVPEGATPAAAPSPPEPVTGPAGQAALSEALEQPEQPEQPEAPIAQQLARAGMDPALAESIEARLAAMEMERLYLRDRATREGWRNSERFATAMQALADPAEALRGEFGDAVYDEYLYATGRGNRIVVTSTLQDSPARLAGIRPGDTLLSYAGARVFSIGDLQAATAAGEPGAYVTVELMRDGARWYASVPRGPLGVRLDITRESPGPG